MAATGYRIAVTLYPGFDELDAFGPYEVLSMALDERDGEVRLVSLGGSTELTASNRSLIRPHASFDGEWDLVIVPGGGWARRRGAFIEAKEGGLPDALAEVHARGTTVASVCTGAMLLAAAGLLDGRPAITHQLAIDDLRDAGAEIVEARVVDDGDVVTSGGIISGVDMALWLVERLWDRELADRIADRIEHRRVGEVHLGPRFHSTIGIDAPIA
jgi:transcriptional regulator GlxA family with amidase domain